MKRVLVPLDGSELAESVVPDARRVAGPEGTLILVREAGRSNFQPGESVSFGATDTVIDQVESYLDQEAALLHSTGIQTEVHTLVLADPAAAIDEAARIFDADLIAIATHGRGPWGRMIHGSVARRALAHSPVPVLLRHLEAPTPASETPAGNRSILVPLDGSRNGEKALALAQELALQWNASIHLVQVVPIVYPAAGLYGMFSVPDAAYREDILAAKAYLDTVAASLIGEVHTTAVLGPIVSTLIELVDRLSITDIVMASHGRSGLSRVIMGSVSDELVRALHIPVIIVPALVPVSDRIREFSLAGSTAP